jgi:hypothetical protein
MRIERLALVLILGLAALLVATRASAQTWQTVDDFQYADGQDSWCYALSVDAYGNVYAAGRVYDGNGVQRGVVRRSTDHGTSWQMVDDLIGEFNAFGIDSAQNLYAVGQSWPDWIVRRSSDRGATWTTVDDVPASGAWGVAADHAGNVYVVGASAGNWIVRKSGDAGTTWTTVDLLPGGGTPICAVCTSAGVFVEGNGMVRMSADGGVNWTTVAHPYTQGGECPDLTADSAGNLYLGANSNATWIVQKGLRDGSAWSIVDSVPPSDRGGSVLGMGADASGNIYAVGVNGGAWLVRKSVDQGARWFTVDQYGDFDVSPAHGFGSDTNGNLYVGGYAGDGLEYTGVAAHWRVRKLAAAPPVPLPVLRVSIWYGSLTLSWPFPSTGFVLESTPSLGSPNWQPAPETPLGLNNQWIVNVAGDRAARYFRLHQ